MTEIKILSTELLDKYERLGKEKSKLLSEEQQILAEIKKSELNISHQIKEVISAYLDTPPKNLKVSFNVGLHYPTITIDYYKFHLFYRFQENDMEIIPMPVAESFTLGDLLKIKHHIDEICAEQGFEQLSGYKNI